MYVLVSLPDLLLRSDLLASDNSVPLHLYLTFLHILRPQYSTRYTLSSTFINTLVPYIWTYAGLMETTNPPVSVETAETTLACVPFGCNFYSAASASLG